MSRNGGASSHASGYGHERDRSVSTVVSGASSAGGGTTATPAAAGASPSHVSSVSDGGREMQLEFLRESQPETLEDLDDGPGGVGGDGGGDQVSETLNTEESFRSIGGQFGPSITPEPAATDPLLMGPPSSSRGRVVGAPELVFDGGPPVLLSLQHPPEAGDSNMATPAVPDMLMTTPASADLSAAGATAGATSVATATAASASAPPPPRRLVQSATTLSARATALGKPPLDVLFDDLDAARVPSAHGSLRSFLPLPALLHIMRRESVLAVLRDLPCCKGMSDEEIRAVALKICPTGLPTVGGVEGRTAGAGDLNERANGGRPANAENGHAVAGRGQTTRRQRQAHHTTVDTGFRKVLAALVLEGKAERVLELMDAGVDDRSLPLTLLKAEGGMALAAGKRAPKLVCFDSWRSRDIEGFYRTQWELCPPFFSMTDDGKVVHYRLHRDVVLPFVDHQHRHDGSGGDDLEATTTNTTTDTDDVGEDGRRRPRTSRDSGRTSLQGGAGNYGVVSKLELHPDQHRLPMFAPPGVKRLVAVKRLKSTSREEFDRESYMLSRLSRLSRPPSVHLTKLLATFELPTGSGSSKNFYLIFPCADMNLKQFWDAYSPRRPPLALLAGDDGGGDIGGSRARQAQLVLARWIAHQCQGLADALSVIHDFKNYRTGSDPDERTKGLHGDIKPENILWYRCWSGREHDELGVLQIADFGLSSYHHATSAYDIKIKAAAHKYRPPEVESFMPISRSFDIWTLGCLYLEFIVWMTEGGTAGTEGPSPPPISVEAASSNYSNANSLDNPDGTATAGPSSVTDQRARTQHGNSMPNPGTLALDAFGDARMSPGLIMTRQDTFYDFDFSPLDRKPIIRVATGVLDMVERLHTAPTTATPFVHDFLDIIMRHMVVVEDRVAKPSEQPYHLWSRILNRLGGGRDHGRDRGRTLAAGSNSRAASAAAGPRWADASDRESIGGGTGAVSSREQSPTSGGGGGAPRRRLRGLASRARASFSSLPESMFGSIMSGGGGGGGGGGAGTVSRETSRLSDTSTTRDHDRERDRDKRPDLGAVPPPPMRIHSDDLARKMLVLLRAHEEHAAAAADEAELLAYYTQPRPWTRSRAAAEAASQVKLPQTTRELIRKGRQRAREW